MRRFVQKYHYLDVFEAEVELTIEPVTNNGVCINKCFLSPEPLKMQICTWVEQFNHVAQK